MNDKTIRYSELTDIKDKLEKVIEALNENCRKHEEFFPMNIRAGILSFEEASEETITAHFLFTASLSESASKIESILCVISEVMMKADKNGDIDTILLCDTMLTRYDELKSAFNQFSEKNEALIKDKVRKTHLSEMYRLFAELKIKINLYSNYTASIEIS